MNQPKSAVEIVHFQDPVTRPFFTNFTRQTTEIIHFAVVFHYDVISHAFCIPVNVHIVLTYPPDKS